jgi:hypothetical protein
VKVQQATAQALRFAVNNVEDFHLLAFREVQETHNRQHYVNILKMAEAVLTVDLCQ